MYLYIYTLYVEHLLSEGKTCHDLSSVACNLQLISSVTISLGQISLPPREVSQHHKQNNNVRSLSPGALYTYQNTTTKEMVVGNLNQRGAFLQEWLSSS